MVTMQENVELEKAFSEYEIKETIFSMEKNTAPRPDHFPIEFYQHCWDFIKEDMVTLFSDFYNLKLDIGRFNYGIITLLPKVKEANNIKCVQTYLSVKCHLQNFHKGFDAKIRQSYGKDY
jgi:hypothetical protein